MMFHHAEFCIDDGFLVVDAEVVEVSPVFLHLGEFGFHLGFLGLHFSFHLFCHFRFAAGFAFFHVAFAVLAALAGAVLADAFAIFAAAFNTLGAA